MELKTLIAQYVKEARKHAGLTGADLGAKLTLELGTDRGNTRANISHWETGKHSPNLEQLIALAKITGKALPSALLPAPMATSVSRVRAVHPEDMLDPDIIYVPESRIEFSGGNGKVAHYELVEDEEPATYRLSWFQKYGINPDRVRRFRVSGRSMEPTLYARDTILVNTDETNIVDGKMYALRYGDELRVKYVFRRLDGTIILRSVNPEFKDEEVSPALAEEHITIIGRVRDRSGTGGL
jgi:phage repressor protein C with HTH and peptisase S24 domain